MSKTKIIFIIIILFSFLGVQAQDIDFYLKNKNDNFAFSEIPADMTFEEYNLLSQNYRMQDMLFASVVPGLIHFKAQEKEIGYSLLAIDGIACATMTYEMLWLKENVSDTVKLFYYLRNTSTLNQTIKSHTKIAGVAVATIGAVYLFDLIHGKYTLELKQNKIRYKYSPQISFSPATYQYNNKFGLGVNIQMTF